MTRLCRSRNSKIAWGAASAAALLYFITSLVVVTGSFVWLGIFPGPWYLVQDALYWPFQVYLDFTRSVMGRPDISYQVYALVSRLPFLLAPVVVWIFALRGSRCGYTAEAGQLYPEASRGWSASREERAKTSPKGPEVSRDAR